MNFKIKNAVVVTLFWVAAINSGASDSLRDISGTYTLTELNGSELPAVSWLGPGEGCKQVVLSATMIADSESRWALLLKEREDCSDRSERETTRPVDSAIFSGSYKVSGSVIEFYDDELGTTDHASLENDILRYTSYGIGAYEGQTNMAVFRRSRQP